MIRSGWIRWLDFVSRLYFRLVGRAYQSHSTRILLTLKPGRSWQPLSGPDSTWPGPFENDLFTSFLAGPVASRLGLLFSTLSQRSRMQIIKIEGTFTLEDVRAILEICKESPSLFES